MWRGIDGELKSKFGELTEKFWKSSSGESPIQAKNFRAIYLTSEGGSGGGKSLSEMGGSNGENLISTESGDQVKSVFGICTNGGNGSGCQGDKNNASVVLVGSEEKFNSGLENKIKGQWNWIGGKGSIVEGGRRYSKIFDRIQTKGGKPRNSGRFNRQTLNLYRNASHEKKALLRNLCSWAETVKSGLQAKCKANKLGWEDVGYLKLPQFLNSDYAKSYFRESVWGQYRTGGKYVALLALLNLWSTDLAQMSFDRSAGIFNSELDKFKLSPLMSSNSKVVYLDADNSGSKLRRISYYSGGMWTVQLCPNSNSCSNDEGLNLTIGNEMFCVIDKVCFAESDNRNSISKGKNGWKSLMGNNMGLWTKVFGSTTGTNPGRAMLISLIVACFSDVKDVSLAVQEPSERGELIFTQLNNEK